MKKIKFLSLLLIAVSAVSLTSCLNDDDDDNNYPTTQEIQTYYNAVRGTHTGKLIYREGTTGTTTNVNDTLDATWSITSDSTMVLRSFPSKAIASCISNEELSNSIASQPDQDILCYIGFLKPNEGIYQWLVNPTVLTYNDVSYNGGSHKLQIVFYGNNAVSYGLYSTTNAAMELQIALYGVYIDGTLNSSIVTQKLFHFIK